MHVQVTPVSAAVETVPTEVALRSIREIPFGELIIALYASDMPDAGPAPEELSITQLAAWVVQGIGRLGEVEVWHRDYQIRRRKITSREVFGNTVREQYAADLALRLDEAMEEIGIDRQPRFGWVCLLPEGQEDFAWQQRMSLRDVEFCFRLCDHNPQKTRRLRAGGAA